MHSDTHDPTVNLQDKSQRAAVQLSDSRNREPTKEEILEGMKKGYQEALAGEYRPIEELLDDLEK